MICTEWMQQHILSLLSALNHQTLRGVSSQVHHPSADTVILDKHLNEIAKCISQKKKKKNPSTLCPLRVSVMPVLAVLVSNSFTNT